MAVHAPITGAPTRASEINRRGLLAGLTIAPAFAAIPADARTESRWDVLRARYERAAAAAKTFDATVHQPERDRIDRIVGERPPLWFEHTAKNGHTARFAIVPEKASPYSMPPFRELYDQALARWEAWVERDRQAFHDARWRAVDAQMARLWVAEGAARAALMREPAPDGRALAFKVQVALSNDELWDQDREALMADVRRLQRIV